MIKEKITEEQDIRHRIISICISVLCNDLQKKLDMDDIEGYNEMVELMAKTVDNPDDIGSYLISRSKK